MRRGFAGCAGAGTRRRGGRPRGWEGWRAVVCSRRSGVSSGLSPAAPPRLPGRAALSALLLGYSLRRGSAPGAGTCHRVSLPWLSPAASLPSLCLHIAGGGGGGWGRRENPRVAGPGAALVLAPLGGVVRALRRFAAAWGFLSSGFPPNLADAPAAIASFQHVLLAARLSAFTQSSPPRPCRGRGGGGY